MTSPTNEPPSDEVPSTPTSTTPPRSSARLYTEWAITIVLAILLSLVVRTYVAQAFSIPSGSMEPTLHVGDRVIVSKLSTRFGAIHIGEILVFRAPAAVAVKCGDNYPDLIKRVIGLPGDTLSSKGNTIYVNGRPLPQPWAHNLPLTPAITTTKVPANHYFMLGDNEYDSCDSRFWGTIPKSSIIGAAVLRIWPISRIGSL